MSVPSLSFPSAYDPKTYWDDRACRFAGQGEGLAAVCSYGMPAFYNGLTHLAQRLALARWLRVPPGTRVLDVGCGVGRWSRLLASRGAVVTGVDLSGAMIAEAERRAAMAGVSHRCRFLVQDAAALEHEYGVPRTSPGDSAERQIYGRRERRDGSKRGRGERLREKPEPGQQPGLERRGVHAGQRAQLKSVRREQSQIGGARTRLEHGTVAARRKVRGCRLEQNHAPARREVIDHALDGRGQRGGIEHVLEHGHGEHEIESAARI